MARKRHRCTLCGREFERGSQLREHVARRHPKREHRWWTVAEDPASLGVEGEERPEGRRVEPIEGLRDRLSSRRYPGGVPTAPLKEAYRRIQAATGGETAAGESTPGGESPRGGPERSRRERGRRGGRNRGRDARRERPAEIPVDVEDRGDEYVLTASLPGYRTQDVDVTARGRRVRVAVADRGDRDGEYVRRERPRRERVRVLELPGRVRERAAAAALHDGVLRVTLPKQDA